MLKQTDFEKVIDVAKTFMYFDVEVNEELPFIAKHPFIDSPYIMLNGDVVNFVESNKLDEFYEQIEEMIDRCGDFLTLFYRITKPFKSAFFKYCMPYLDDHDFAKGLREVWQHTEFLSTDPNISKAEYVRFFKKAKKGYLMEQEELDIYSAHVKMLPEIVLYRGINDANDFSDVNSLSWTNDEEIAKWFAQRFLTHGRTGQVLKTRIDTKYLLAFFAQEKEFIIDYKGIKNLEIVETFDHEGNKVNEDEDFDFDFTLIGE